MGWDWLELSACVGWSGHPEHGDAWDVLERARDLARERRAAQPVRLDGFTLWVSGRGDAGGGPRGSYCEFVAGFGAASGKASHAVTVHLDRRQTCDRGLHNARVRLTGTAWATYGEGAFTHLTDLLEWLGGEIADAWPRRADLKVDAVWVPSAPILRGVEAGCFTSRCRRRGGVERDGQKLTGTTLGRGGRASVTIYDKRQELLGKAAAAGGPAYIDGLLTNLRLRPDLSGDVPLRQLLPRDLTRFEWRANKAFFDMYGVRDMRSFWDRRADVAAKLAGLGDDSRRPLLRLTDRPADRAAGHQSRAETSALWQKVLGAVESWSGTSRSRLTPTPAMLMPPEMLDQRLASMLCQLAAYDGVPIRNAGDLNSYGQGRVHKLAVAGGFTDEWLAARSMAKLDAAGNLDAVTTRGDGHELRFLEPGEEKPVYQRDLRPDEVPF